MSGIFDAYDQEFSSISRDITKHLTDFRASSSGSKRDVLARQLDGFLGQAAELIKQMEVEVRSLDPATRKQLNDKIAQYRRALTSLKTDFNSAREQADRSELIGSKSGEQRQRLLDTNDKLVEEFVLDVY